MTRIEPLCLTATVLLASATLSGCTTATYGIKPAPVAGQHDTFKFKIFTGGFAAGGTADDRVVDELEQHKTANGYRSYTIVDKRYNIVPSYFEYTVKFAR